MSRMNQAAYSVNASKYVFDVVTVDNTGESHDLIGESLPIEAAIARAAGYNAGSKELVAVAIATAFTAADNADTPHVDPQLATLRDEFAADFPAKAPDVDSGACSCHHDSDVKTEAQHATAANVEDDSEADDDTMPETRSFRVAVLRGSGELDIVSRLMTEDEAAAEGRKYANVEDVFIAQDLTSEPEAEDDGAEAVCKIRESRADFVQAATRAQLAIMERALPFVFDSGDIGLLACSLREVAKTVDGIGKRGSIVEVPESWGFDDALDVEGWHNDDLKAALGLEVGEAATA